MKPMSRGGIIESSDKEVFAYVIFKDPRNRCYYETREYYTSNGTPVSKKLRADRELHKHFMHPEGLKLLDLNKVPNKRKAFLEKYRIKSKEEEEKEKEKEKEKGKGKGKGKGVDR